MGQHLLEQGLFEGLPGTAPETLLPPRLGDHHPAKSALRRGSGERVQKGEGRYQTDRQTERERERARESERDRKRVIEGASTEAIKRSREGTRYCWEVFEWEPLGKSSICTFLLLFFFASI